MKKFLISLFIAFILIGCGQPGSQNPVGPQPKGLFSSWTASDSTKLVLNLSSIKMGFNKIPLTYQNLDCSCALVMAGSQAQGSYNIYDCVASSAGGTNIACANTFSQSGTFQLDNSILTLCTTTAANPSLQIPEGGDCKQYK